MSATSSHQWRPLDPINSPCVIICHSTACSPFGLFNSMVAYWNSCIKIYPHSKVHGANMVPIGGRQDPGGPHAGPMNLVIWVGIITGGSIFSTELTIDAQYTPKGKLLNLFIMSPKSYLCLEGIVQDCNNSLTDILELLQSCTKPSVWPSFTTQQKLADQLGDLTE